MRLLKMYELRIWRINILLAITICLGIGNSKAQNRNLTDSLENFIQDKKTHDTLRVLSMCRLSWDIKDKEPNRSIQLIKEATSLSKKINFLHGEALSLINTGGIYYDMGKRKEALEYWFKSIAVYKKMAKSKQSYVKSVGLHGITDNLISISRLYCEIGELNNFEKHVAEAKEIMKDNPTEYSRLGWIGIEWAGCYYINGKYDEAKILYNDALKSFSVANDEYGIANTLANFGMLHNKLDQPDSALIYLKRSLKLYTKVKSLDGQSWVNNIMGNVYKRNHNIDSAFYYFQEAYSNGVEANNAGTQISSLINLGNLLNDNYRAQESFRYWKKAYDLSVENATAEFILTTSMFLANYSEKTGDYKSAVNYFKSYLTVKDSLNTNENMKTIGKLESQYDFDKEQAMQATRHEQELSAQRSIAIAEKKQQKFIIATITISLVIVLIFSVFLYNRVRITQKQKHVIALQKEIVTEKNREILDSIKYAKRIQAAVLPTNAAFKELLPDSFIIYKPKDIVAGDFYWLEYKNDTILVAACDCTGHGVPGAMVSVICNNGLNRSVREHNITSPNEILNKTREIVIEEFKKSNENVYDGMDVALVSLKYSANDTTNTVILNFSGANNPVWIIRNNSDEMEVIAGDKQPIGKSEYFKPYQKHERILNRGDRIYLFTDGYKDQFGGGISKKGRYGAGKKFKSSHLKKLILSIKENNMQDQKVILEEEFENWRGDFEQIDDVCVIGFRL